MRAISLCHLFHLTDAWHLITSVVDRICESHQLALLLPELHDSATQLQKRADNEISTQES